VRGACPFARRPNYLGQRRLWPFGPASAHFGLPMNKALDPRAAKTLGKNNNLFKGDIHASLYFFFHFFYIFKK
jgi:hypothetical protein